MTTTPINRGTTAIFNVRFANQAHEPMPDMDIAKIYFRQQNGPREEFDLQHVGEIWTYSLDTGTYKRGMLRWWVYGKAGNIEITDQGDLHLIGNSANLES